MPRFLDTISYYDSTGTQRTVEYVYPLYVHFLKILGEAAGTEYIAECTLIASDKITHGTSASAEISNIAMLASFLNVVYGSSVSVPATGRGYAASSQSFSLVTSIFGMGTQAGTIYMTVYNLVGSSSAISITSGQVNDNVFLLQ